MVPLQDLEEPRPGGRGAWKCSGLFRVDADLPEGGGSARGGPPFGAGRPGSRLHPPAPSTWQGPSCLLNSQEQKERRNRMREEKKCPKHLLCSTSHSTLPGAERWAVGGSLTGALPRLSGRARCPARGEIQKAQVIPPSLSSWWKSPVQMMVCGIFAQKTRPVFLGWPPQGPHEDRFEKSSCCLMPLGCGVVAAESLDDLLLESFDCSCPFGKALAKTVIKEIITITETGATYFGRGPSRLPVLC